MLLCVVAPLLAGSYVARVSRRILKTPACASRLPRVFRPPEASGGRDGGQEPSILRSKPLRRMNFGKGRDASILQLGSGRHL
ncbi:MAG: hypothetical protein MUP16_05865 [Sedimentisphaerales bacterium]|nr:hypothetical protein [Sedimentisphaerales bacterium]